MKLINADGLALIGPGSEWFWSMAQFVLIAVSLLGIYFQVRAQRASSLSEQTGEWFREWTDEAFAVTRLAVLIDLEGRKIETGLPRSSADIGDYFDRLGYLVAKKNLRPEDVWHNMRQAVGDWWTLLEPYLPRTRQDIGNRYLWEWFEKLELEMRRIDQSLGQPLTFESSSDEVARRIDHLTIWLQIRSDARKGIYPTRRAEPEDVPRA